MDFTLLLEVPNTRIFQIKGDQSQEIHRGILQLFESPTVVFMKSDQFQYPLQKNIPIMQKLLANNAKMYILPALNDFFYGIIVPHIDQVSEVLEFVLSNKAQLVEPQQDQQAMFMKSVYLRKGPQIEVPKEQVMKNVRVIDTNLWENVGAGEKQPGVADYLKKGGMLIRDGLIAGAGYLAEGIKKGGHLISQNVEPTKTEINDDTVKKLQMANTGAKAIVSFTKAQVEALINMGKVIGVEASKQFADSDTGKQFTDYKYYQEVKEVGGAVIVTFVTIYDGLYEALATLGKGTAEASTEIIQQKYGEKAGEVSKQGFEFAGNVGQFAYVYEETAAKAIIQQQQQDQNTKLK